MNKKNVLILGSGGRECALAWKLSKSILLNNLYVAPGNAGTLKYSQNIELDILDFDSILEFVNSHNIDVIICGPELPAVNGIWDFFKIKLPKLIVVAPSKISAMLEGSKSIAKQFMLKNNIPTAKYLDVQKQNIDQGYKWIDETLPPYVIKADGLAEGKGVFIVDNVEEAKGVLDDFILNSKFGEASKNVVLEEFLDGKEFSVFVFTDTNSYTFLPNAKDYKRRFENDKGPNTGGMGCISPVPFVDDSLMSKVEKEIVIPTIEGLKNDKMPYFGFIYFGLININGEPKVIEYNCRLGDPETQVILPRIKSDLLAMIINSFENNLVDKIDISNNCCSSIILVSEGYPNMYNKGYEISGIDLVSDSIIFEAGAKTESNKIMTNGGRVLAISTLDDSLKQSLNIGYQNVDKIDFKGKSFRKDIGFEFQ